MKICKKFCVIFLFFLLYFFSINDARADKISGNVRQDDALSKKSTVVNSEDNSPISGAKIYVPNYNYSTTTDKNGKFQLNIDIDDKAILQIEKHGFRPFSLTIDKTITDTPLVLGIQKTDASDVFIERGVYHLGDNLFSQNSANCRQFKLKSIGPYYYKKIRLEKIPSDKEAVIVFGSIIGLDTKKAKELGQNAIVSVYSSPLKVIFNGEKISEIHLNGDNQEVPIPNSLIRETNELTLQTGKNLFQYEYTDYDDMEFANLRIEVRNKMYANK